MRMKEEFLLNEALSYRNWGVCKCHDIVKVQSKKKIIESYKASRIECLDHFSKVFLMVCVYVWVVHVYSCVSTHAYVRSRFMCRIIPP